MKKEIINNIKYGASIGSKVFLGISVVNMIITLVTTGVLYEDTMYKLVVTFACIASILIFENFKLRVWAKYALSYAFVCIIMVAYMSLTVGYISGTLLLNTLGITTIIFIIVVAVENTKDHIKAKKAKVKAEGDEQP
ncbi:MAG: hypothetical protein FWC76_03790 [Defluviitaleaceae bacterium]|nr:hypothetical protein [Defluviitaleaceae bacterium]